MSGGIPWHPSWSEGAPSLWLRPGNLELLEWLFIVAPVSRAGSRVRLRAGAGRLGRNSARPSGASPGRSSGTTAISWAPGSSREPKRSLSGSAWTHWREQSHYLYSW